MCRFIPMRPFLRCRTSHHLLVIGGGPIGIEMAQAHRRLGCKVTVVEAFTIMGRDDAELVGRLKKRLEDEQITLIENTQITSVSQQGGSICIDLADGHSVKGSHLLVAVGRRPNIEALHLEAGQIAYTAKGITTDEGCAPHKNIFLRLGMCRAAPVHTCRWLSRRYCHPQHAVSSACQIEP